MNKSSIKSIHANWVGNHGMDYIALVLLAAIFRIRIELRQAGVRDESKMLGGVAQCGFVTSLNIIKEKVTVRFPDEDGVLRDFPKDEVTIVGGKKHKSKKNDNDEYADLSPEEIAELKKLQQKTKESVEGDL